MERVLAQFDNLVEYIGNPSKKRPLLYEQFRPLATLAFQHYDWVKMPRFGELVSNRKIKFSDVNNYIVCFSDGVKSAALAYYALKRYGKVLLYHRYHTKVEFDNVTNIANKIGVELYVDYTPVNWDIITCLAEVYNGALTLAYEQDFGSRILIGSYNNDSIYNVRNFKMYAKGCREVWEAVENIWGSFIDDYRLARPFMNIEDVFDIVREHPAIFWYKNGCVNCGLEWKIIFTDYEIGPPVNRQGYFDALSKLQRQFVKETHRVPYTAEELWENYFFYSMLKSRYYWDLKNYGFKNILNVAT